MTPPTDTRTLRDRDVEIAKRLGWTVERMKEADYTLFGPDGHSVFPCTRLSTEELAWTGVPHYFTDIRDAAGLKVELMARGWFNDVECISNGKAFVRFGFVTDDGSAIHVDGQASDRDPQAAWCDAVSEACLKALEVSKNE